jgi:hypothetical protein
VPVEVLGEGRRALLLEQFQVPTKNFIDERSGLGSIGIGVVSICCAPATQASAPLKATARTPMVKRFKIVSPKKNAREGTLSWSPD